MCRKRAARWFILLLGFPATLQAQSAGRAPSSYDGPTRTAPSISPSDEVRREAPIMAYTYAAHGTEAKTFGVHAYGLGLAAAGQDSVVGGGGAVWGSPIERLTLIVDGQRNLSREFSPSAAAIVRLYGNGREGFSLGALGKFKVDGFAEGPGRDEIESEVELGALASYRNSTFYLDMNAIAGRGTGDEGEGDAEGRLRLGGYLGSHFRFGIDSQLRARVAGPRYLPNGRTWDFAAGPQAITTWDHFYASLIAGPATTGLVSRSIGWTAMLSVGAASF
jgi:hypothetical protein